MKGHIILHTQNFLNSWTGDGTWNYFVCGHHTWNQLVQLQLDLPSKSTHQKRLHACQEAWGYRWRATISCSGCKRRWSTSTDQYQMAHLLCPIASNSSCKAAPGYKQQQLINLYWWGHVIWMQHESRNFSMTFPSIQNTITPKLNPATRTHKGFKSPVLGW